MKIYIACSLTHVPRAHFTEYASFIHEAARVLGRDHAVKYALVNSDPQLARLPFNERAKRCYEWDRKMVTEADVVVAEASFPSTGLGIELEAAASHRLPIVLCFRNFGDNVSQPVTYENPDHSRHELQIGEGHISLMALGIPTVKRVIEYRTSSEGVAMIETAVRALAEDQPRAA
jgi:hypothetical protein